MSRFPKAFLDLKAFHSTKAQALVDTESSVEESHAVLQHQRSSGVATGNANTNRSPIIDARLLSEPGENRLLSGQDDRMIPGVLPRVQSQAVDAHVVRNNDNLIVHEDNDN